LDKSSARAKSEEASAQIVFDDNQLVQQLAGARSSHLKIIEKQLDVRIHLRGNQFSIAGEEAHVELTERLLAELADLIQKGYPVYDSDIVYAIRILSENLNRNLKDIFLDHVFISSHKRTISPKSVKQKEYIEAIRHYDVVFGIGPAGTGKTYLAMAMAVAAMTKELVRRIVLVRPAVEAGEKLGFLPGDLAEKVDPYLRPLYDALYDLMGFDKVTRCFEKGIIEIAPLAFMRGRTLNHSFIILDEAQNTSPEQMKMFLTRIGFGSKAVVTGDPTQIDLPKHQKSGLIDAQEVLSEVRGIAMHHFTSADVVRHPLVQKIVDAYERNTKEREAAKPDGNHR